MSDAERTMMFQLPNQLSGKLVCVGGTMAGRTFELSGGTFTIGRASDSDLCLVDEPGVSKQHAKIVGQGANYAVVDCESRNGTFVNSEAVSPQRQLADGDEIRICGCILRLQQTGVGPARTRSTSSVPLVVTTMPSMPAFTGTMEAAEPMYEAPPVTIPPEREEPRRSQAPALAGWFAAGLAGMVVVGGGAGFAFTDPPVTPMAIPAPVAVAAAVTLPPVPPVPPSIPPPVPVEAVAAKELPVVDEPAAPATNGKEVLTSKEDVVVADAAVADAEESSEPSRKGSSPRKPRAPRPQPAAEEPAEESAAEDPVQATAPSAPSGVAAGKSFAASPDVPSETIKTKGAGRVKSVAFADGADVDKGETLVMFDAGGSEEEVATLQDRIASLQSAEGEDAQRELKAAKGKLQALLAGAKSPPIVAPMTGKLSGFTVQPGQVLKAGDVVGKIIESDAPARVKITIDKSVKVKTGQGVVLELQTGATAQGSVLAISGKTVFVDTGGAAPEQVARVRFE